MRASTGAITLRAAATTRSVISSLTLNWRCRSTGLPAVMIEAMPSPRRNPAAW